jgi:glycogen debranching enzyme
LTEHPTRKGPKEGKWYGNVCIPGNTALLVNSEQALQRLALEMGDHEMAARRQKRIDKATAAMREHMWDEDLGVFVSVKRDTLEKIRVGTIGGFMALKTDIPTDAMKARMAEVMRSDHWQTPLPVPTVDAKDPRYDPGAYWRGNVWPVTNYQVATGFAQQGFADIAADIADKSVANAMKHGVYEFYNSQTKKGGGVPYLGMSGTVLTMMLDGLTREHLLSVRDKK